MDALSEILRALKLTGTDVTDGEHSAAWSVSVKAGAAARFHYLMAGGATLEIEGREALRLQVGDVALLPHGQAHRLSERGKARLVSGAATLERSLADPLLTALPVLVVTNVRGTAIARHVEESLGFTLSASDAPRAGASAGRSRLGELLVIEALRGAIESTRAGETGWLAAANDRHVGTALALLHGRPSEAWKVEKLARQAGLSRSALAEHFTRLLGEPPITYLTKWRLCLAAQALATTAHEVRAIAKDAGYESAGAFSHAFKRAFGKPPTRWRRTQRKARDRKGSDTSYR